MLVRQTVDGGRVRLESGRPSLGASQLSGVCMYAAGPVDVLIALCLIVHQHAGETRRRRRRKKRKEGEGRQAGVVKAVVSPESEGAALAGELEERQQGTTLAGA